MSLVTLAQAKAHLRIDTPDSSPMDAADLDLSLKLAAAEEIVLDYLKVPATSPPLWTDETDAPALVQVAILLQLGELYRFRGDDEAGRDSAQTTGDLSPIVTNILRRYRDPALA